MKRPYTPVLDDLSSELPRLYRYIGDLEEEVAELRKYKQMYNDLLTGSIRQAEEHSGLMLKAALAGVFTKGTNK